MGKFLLRLVVQLYLHDDPVGQDVKGLVPARGQRNAAALTIKDKGQRKEFSVEADSPVPAAVILLVMKEYGVFHADLLIVDLNRAQAAFGRNVDRFLDGAHLNGVRNLFQAEGYKSFFKGHVLYLLRP